MSVLLSTPLLFPPPHLPLCRVSQTVTSFPFPPLHAIPPSSPPEPFPLLPPPRILPFPLTLPFPPALSPFSLPPPGPNSCHSRPLHLNHFFLPHHLFDEAESSSAVSTVPLLRGVLTRRPLVAAQTKSAAFSALTLLPFSSLHYGLLADVIAPR